MKFTNRFVALILVVVMIFSMISCGKKTWKEKLESFEKLKRNDLEKYYEYDLNELNEMFAKDHHLNVFFIFSKECFPDIPDTSGLPKKEADEVEKAYFNQVGTEIAEKIGLYTISDIKVVAPVNYARKGYRDFDAFVDDLDLFGAILEHDEIEGLVVDCMKYTVQQASSRSNYESVTTYTESAMFQK